MTQKKPQPTHTTRIRDNQRRSRARRKEYVEELEKRLRNFERYGVSANVEIQRAARKVAGENLLLRELLRHHGVADSEIEEYVRDCAVSGPGSSGQGREGLLMRHALPAGPVACKVLGFAKSDTTAVEERGRLVGNAESDVVVLTEENDSSGRASPLTSSPSRHPLEHVDSRTSTHPANKTNTLCRPDPPNPTNQVQSLEDVTSCEIAANIIAGMRGHNNDEEARAELGCSPDDKCVVENMTIFSLMDR
jgi:hypothetical protein